MITDETISLYIDLSFNVAIAFLGIGFTVFTLLYAFIQTKKDALKDIEEVLNTEGGSMTILRRRNSAIRFAQKMRKVNVDAIVIIISSFICFIIAGVLKLLNLEWSGIWKWMVVILFMTYFIIIIGSFIRAFIKIMKAYTR